MLNIHELEKRWFRYKVKSFIPHIVIILSLLILLSLAFIFVPSRDKVTIVKKEEVQVIQKITKPQINVKEKEKEKEKEKIVTKKVNKIEEVQVVEEQVKLQPSLSFMKNLQADTELNYQKIVAPAPQKKKKTPKIEHSHLKSDTVKKVDIVKKNKKIKIRRKNTNNDIQEVILRFKKNNNPALSLFIAKKSYELGDYKQAYNYSLITNQINNNIETSWIIFAKSLVKLGKKKKAITLLKKYISNTHSNNASILLDEISSGDFQ